MDFIEFTSFRLSRLSNENIYGLSNSTISMGETTIGDMGSLAQAILSQLKVANTAMAEVIKKSAGSLLTIQIEELDNERDAMHNSIKRAISFYAKEEDTETRKAAEVLKKFFAPYWDINDSARDTQTALTSDLLAKYKSDKDLVDKATLIGITTRFTNLEKLNTGFDTLNKSRNTEQAAQVSPSATSLRPDVELLYHKFCQVIEMEMNFKPGDAITQLFGELNNLRKKYSVLVSKTETVESENIAAGSSN